MKKIIFIVLCIVFIANTSFAITNVPGDFYSIQLAIDVAAEGDTILVAPGTYGQIDFLGKDIIVASLFLTTQDTAYISQTIISAATDSVRTVTFENGETKEAVLTGFTITDGYGYNGAGIIIDNVSSPTLSHLIVTGNYCTTDGGGVAVKYGSNPILTNIIISENSARYWGGGFLCSYKSSVTLNNVIISNNTCGSYSTIGNGAAFYSQDSSNVILNNVLITDNVSEPNGAVIYYRTGSTITINNAICSNNTGNYGIHNDDSVNPSISYSCFWNSGDENFHNCDSLVGENIITNANGDSSDIYYNIQLDPLFEDEINKDYHLTLNSPCIDAGMPNISGLNLPIYDLDGNQRVHNSIIDIGPYEFGAGTEIDDDFDFISLPDKLVLHQNYPNPFNPSTTIKFSVKENNNAKLTIYNISGQSIKHYPKFKSGNHTIEWNGKDDNNISVSSGIYFYKLESDMNSQVRKMLLIK